MEINQIDDEIKLNVHSKTGICDQIQAEVLRLIHEGRLLPGDILPPVRQVAERLGVNFNTVARAYRNLDQAGWVFTRQGRGTFVRQSLDQLDRSIDHEAELLAQLAEHIRKISKQRGLSEPELLARLARHMADTNINAAALLGAQKDAVSRTSLRPRRTTSSRTSIRRPRVGQLSDRQPILKTRAKKQQRKQRVKQ